MSEIKVVKVVKPYYGTDCKVDCNEIPEDLMLSDLYKDNKLPEGQEDYPLRNFAVSGLTTDTLRVADKLAGLVCSDDGEITDQDDLSHWYALHTVNENDRDKAGSVYANRNAPKIGMDRVCHRAMWWNRLFWGVDGEKCKTSEYGVDSSNLSVDDDDHGDEQVEVVIPMAKMRMNTWTNRLDHYFGSAFAFMADAFCDVAKGYRDNVIGRLATSPHGFSKADAKEIRDGVLILITAFIPFVSEKLLGSKTDADAEDVRVRGIVDAAFSVMGEAPGQGEFAKLMKTVGVDFESMRIKATSFIIEGATALKKKAKDKGLSKKQRKAAAGQIQAKVASFKEAIKGIQNKINEEIDLFAMKRDQQEFIHSMRSECMRLSMELDKLSTVKVVDDRKPGGCKLKPSDCEPNERLVNRHSSRCRCKKKEKEEETISVGDWG